MSITIGEAANESVIKSMRRIISRQDAEIRALKRLNEQLTEALRMADDGCNFLHLYDKGKAAT